MRKIEVDYVKLEAQIQPWIKQGLTSRAISLKLKMPSYFITKRKHNFSEDTQKALKANAAARKKQANREWNIEFFSIVKH